MTSQPEQGQLRFYVAHPHECAYLPEREATMVLADPKFPKSTAIYSVLIANGFRRSGEMVYRPMCEGCQACVPVRVPVRGFRPRRSQRRAWQRNQDLEVGVLPEPLTDETYALYRRYINTRHAGGSMEDPTREAYLASVAEAAIRLRNERFLLDEDVVAIMRLASQRRFEQ